MKAARLHPDASSLIVEEVPDPPLRPGSVIVRLQAAFASHFITKIVDGSGGYATPPRPFIPGVDAIGTVESLGLGVRGLSLGERVYCDPYFEPRFPAGTGERIFVGAFGVGPQSLSLLKEWPDGAYAEKVCLPAECAVPIPATVDVPDEILCRLGWLGTAYGGWRKAKIPLGAIVAVNGASGLLGSSAVVAALALGASRVFALGRRAAALEALASLDERVVASTDAAALPPLDIALTSVDGEDSASLEALLPRLRRHGTFVVVGAPKAPLSLNVRWLMVNEITLRGSFWFDHAQANEMLRLTVAGQLDWSVFAADLFPLSRVSDALAAAVNRANPLRHVAIGLA
jgi:D-arabinose 1-dehydrogenase-like Zn-dependent alcohol dehydrogenase